MNDTSKWFFFSQRVIIGFGNKKVFFSSTFFQVCISRKKSSVSLCVSLVARWYWGFDGLWCSVVWRGVTSPPESFAVKTEPKHVWVCVCECVPSSETWDFEHVIIMSDCCFYGHFVVLSFSCWNSFYIRSIQQEALEDGFLMKRGGEGCFRGGVWWKRSKGRIRIRLPCHYLTVPQSK